MDPELAPQFVDALYRSALRDSKWLKAAGILLVVTGIPSAIILIGLLNIWMGILILQGAWAVDREGPEGLLTLVEKLGKYFRIYVVVAIVGLVVGLIMTVVFFSGMMDALEHDFLRVSFLGS